jgi:hypothetical protein
MNFLTLLSKKLQPDPKLRCNAIVWRAGVEELHVRTGNRIESGAFLLGRDSDGTRTIHEFLFYDDIDPDCFRRGIVEFNGRLLGKVWSYCRNNSLAIVADVHVHPYGYGQSPSDMQNPIVASAGHIALILPNFARGPCIPGGIGIYEYLGNRNWKTHTRDTSFFQVHDD